MIRKITKFKEKVYKIADNFKWIFFNRNFINAKAFVSTTKHKTKLIITKNMKKIIFLLIVLLIGSFQVKSQSILDSLSLDLKLGSRFFGNTSELTKIAPGVHASGGLVYSVNKTFSLKGELCLDTYYARDSSTRWNNQIKYANTSDRSLLMRTNLLGVVNLSQLFNGKSNNFQLNLNAGVGLATNFNSGLSLHNLKHPISTAKENDNMLSAIVGLSPKFKVSPRVSIIGDVSFAYLLKQSAYIDRALDATSINTNDKLLSISLGASFKLKK